MEDKEKQWALAIEEANTLIQLELRNAMIDKINKELIKTNVSNIIDNMASRLKKYEAPIDFIDKAVNSAKMRFVEWYTLIIQEIKKNAIKQKNAMLYSTYESITGEELRKTNAMQIHLIENDEINLKEGSIPETKNFVTTQERGAGQAYMDDYVKVVKNNIKKIASKNLTLKDKLGRSISIRNLAEMTARYEDTRNHLSSLKEKGLEYVVASTHVNASKRCQIWQGKIFKLDINPNAQFVQKVDLSYKPIPIGKIDDIDYYSLKDAMEHGFLGYNCRHRFVKYTKGMDTFKKYPASQIERERNLELKQRNFERNIRMAKKNQILALTKDEKNKWIEVSQRLQREYETFCTKNKLTRNDWRTSISVIERQTFK